MDKYLYQFPSEQATSPFKGPLIENKGNMIKGMTNLFSVRQKILFHTQNYKVAITECAWVEFMTSQFQVSLCKHYVSFSRLSSCGKSLWVCGFSQGCPKQPFFHGWQAAFLENSVAPSLSLPSRKLEHKTIVNCSLLLLYFIHCKSFSFCKRFIFILFMNMCRYLCDFMPYM